MTECGRLRVPEILTEVIFTPQSVSGGGGVGARGVSINSKSSDPSEARFAIANDELKH